MNKKWIAIAGILSVLAVVGFAGCSEGTVSTGEIASISLNSQQQGIWVSGTGEVAATPDIAYLSVGIEAQNTSVADAKDQAAQAMQDVMDALTAGGIASKDIQTDYFSINQVTSWDRDTGKSIVDGYQVVNTVTVTIRNIDNVGKVIDSVAGAGGNLTRINNISFSVEDPSPYYELAREAAMKDAKAKAEQLADLSNVNLGSVTYVSESSSYYPPIATRAAAIAYDEGAGYATSISPGELDISINVQVTYGIK